MQTVISKFNRDFGSGFNFIDIKSLENIPPDGLNYDNFIHLGIFQAKKHSDNWAFGSGLSCILLLNSDKDFYNNLNNNVKIDMKLTRKIRSNFYTSLGGNFSTNYKLGFEPTVFNSRSRKMFESPYGEIYLSFIYTPTNISSEITEKELEV